MEINPDFEVFPLDPWICGIHELCKGPDGPREVYAPASKYVLKSFPNNRGRYAERSSRLASALHFLRLKWSELQTAKLVHLDSSRTPRFAKDFVEVLHTAFTKWPVPELTSIVSVPLVVRMMEEVRGSERTDQN